MTLVYWIIFLSDLGKPRSLQRYPTTIAPKQDVQPPSLHFHTLPRFPSMSDPCVCPSFSCKATFFFSSCPYCCHAQVLLILKILCHLPSMVSSCSCHFLKSPSTSLTPRSLGSRKCSLSLSFTSPGKHF